MAVSGSQKLGGAKSDVYSSIIYHMYISTFSERRPDMI